MYTRSNRVKDFDNVAPVSALAHGLQDCWYKDDVDRGLLERAIPLDISPIPPVQLREGYHGDRHLDYWVSGLADYERAMQVWAQLRSPDPPSRVLDFGGSSGRVARHFAYLHPSSRVVISDIGIGPVEWANLHLPGNCVGFQNDYLGSLPMPERYFDLIVANSVFTHMDSVEYFWLCELSRVCSREGLLFVSVATEKTWDAFMRIDWRYETMLATVIGFDQIERGAPMPAGVGKLAFPDSSGVYVNTFHRISYIEQVWGKFMRIERIIEPRDVMLRGDHTFVAMSPKL